MSHYYDPTASRALGSINREFSRQEKIAKKLCSRYLQGKLSPQEWDVAHTQFKGIYRHVLDHALKKMLEEIEKQKAKA